VAVEKKWGADEAGRDEPCPSRWQELPQGSSQLCSEGRRESSRLQGEETATDKVGITSSCTATDHIFMQGTAKCILCWLRVPSNASRPSESHNSFVVVEWKGTRYEMPRANLQSCWHLIYVCGVCLPRISLIPWLSGLTSPMGLKGMISTGATGTKGRSRHAQLCLSISHLEMIYRAKCTSKRAGVREGSKLWNISAVHHTVSGSFALLSALVWRAGKNLVVKKREIKLTGDQTGDPFGRYLAQIFVEQLLGKVR